MAKPYASGVLLPASVAGGAPLRIPHGTAPSSPVDGDVWTTSAGVFARVNGATVGPFSAGGGGSAFDEITAASGSSTDADLWGDLTTGDIKIGSGLTSGNVEIGNPGWGGEVQVRRDSGSPSMSLTNMSAAGYGPAFLRLARRGASDGATPNGSAIGEIRFDGKDSGGGYANFASIAVEIGTNASGGAPAFMMFRTAPSGGDVANALKVDAAQDTTLYGSLFPLAGTTAKAPVDFTAGSLLTTPAGGAMEYDGKAPYFTPNGSAVGGRAVDLTAHFYRLTSARSLSNASTKQSIFGVGCTLAANTTYLIEMEVLFTATSGGTAASVELSFGGTAGISSIAYRAIAAHSGTSGATAASASNFVFVTTAANTLVVPSGTNWYKRVSVHGIVSINGTSGTFIPQAKWSAAPGGAPGVAVNSFVKLTPIGSDTVNSIGAWS